MWSSSSRTLTQEISRAPRCATCAAGRSLSCGPSPSSTPRARFATPCAAWRSPRMARITAAPTMTITSSSRRAGSTLSSPTTFARRRWASLCQTLPMAACSSSSRGKAARSAAPPTRLPRSRCSPSPALTRLTLCSGRAAATSTGASPATTSARPGLASGPWSRTSTVTTPRPFRASISSKSTLATWSPSAAASGPPTARWRRTP
mmetsp:Transcript_99/g.265  ORF Transcript_99/g.265 Transcript_99/m.265 type:complete len:205 (+) Transcript_99:692-1306(+)